MRGKKIDNDFLTGFITNCAENNKCLPEEIVNEAKIEIENIENKIKEVEVLKLRRSKLLDVITIFNSDKKETKHDEVKVLHYFNIENQHICKFICDALVNNNLKIDTIKSNMFSESDILYCVKQLLEHKIIYRTGDCILRGVKFEEYCKAVLGK
jgi:hypothetical protein